MQAMLGFNDTFDGRKLVDLAIQEEIQEDSSDFNKKDKKDKKHKKNQKASLRHGTVSHDKVNYLGYDEGSASRYPSI